MSKHFFALSLLVAFSFNAFSVDNSQQTKEGVYAHASPTTVADNPEHWFEKHPSQIMILSAFDVILMRKDPPSHSRRIASSIIASEESFFGLISAISSISTAIFMFGGRLWVVAY
jgi:hypothetical protein